MCLAAATFSSIYMFTVAFKYSMFFFIQKVGIIIATSLTDFEQEALTLAFWLLVYCAFEARS